MRSAPLKSMWSRTRQLVVELVNNTSGMGATEFAFIVPIMMAFFFGMVEFSSGVAVDRKVTLVARTLADLTAQSSSLTSTEMQNFIAASSGILNPYDVTPIRPTVSELYVNASKVAKVQWSVAGTVKMVNGAATTTLSTSSRTAGSTVTIPSALAIAGTYLILTEVSYQYVPAVGYVMAKAGVNLNDQTYTRPRQTSCVDYPPPVSPASPCTPVP